MSLKSFAYRVARSTGGFRLASRWSRGRLCVLCYHGFSFMDEHEFRPKLFMTPDRFESRMRWLKLSGYATLTIGEAVERMRAGRLRDKEIVVTIDDGFHGVFALAAPILCGLGMTATVYVTTYYVVKQSPVFRLAMQYLFWKTKRGAVRLGESRVGLPEQMPTKGSEGERALDTLIDWAETALDESARIGLTRQLAARLDVDYDELCSSRRLTLMNAEEIRGLADKGFDIQLHTHRHRIPKEPSLVMREIEDNRRVLAPLTGRPLTDLCYPSGAWSHTMWPALSAAGVRTATTCDVNLNRTDTPPLALTRFLDFHDMPEIVFEAELCGLGSLLRAALRR